MSESDEFENVDDDADPGDDEEAKAAKAIWVRVANSTRYTMKVETFTDRAERQEVQGINVEAKISVPIPGLDLAPSLKVERPNVPLDHNTPGPGGPYPTVINLAGYACDKVWINADTDENSELVTLRITKIDAGGPHFLGQEGSSWTITKKQKRGVIIIVDPDNVDKLLVISAAGQFFLGNRWKPHPGYGNPNLKKTYDPKKMKKT